MQQGLLLGAVKGRVFRFTFTATVPETGLAATCAAQLCR